MTSLRSITVVMLTILASPIAMAQSALSDINAVPLFQAIDEQIVHVRYIAIDASKGNLLIENLNDDGVIVELPRAFGAVPILAQFGNRIGGGQPAGGQGGGGQNVGGNAGGGNGMIGGGQNGGQNQIGQNPGGFMRIPPGKTVRRATVTVCLEYGKPDPRPSMPYRIVPIETLTSDQPLVEVCASLGGDDLDSISGQAAAWHLANGISWKSLADLPAHRSRYLPRAPRFNQQCLESAQRFVDAARIDRGHGAAAEPEQSARSDWSTAGSDRSLASNRSE